MRREGRRPKDDGVSPVIAVVILVGMTAFLAATVYAWTGGIAAGERTLHQIALRELPTNGCTPGGSGTGSFRVSVLTVSAGFPSTELAAKDPSSGAALAPPTGTSNPMAAGDTMAIAVSSGALQCAPGDTIEFVDLAANDVLTSVTLHA